MRPLPALASALVLLTATLPFAAGAGESQPCAATFDTTVPFTDYCYHQGVWFVPDTAQVDVLIVPPVGPWAVRDIQLATESVDMWDAGLHALAGPALDGLVINAYTLGMEPVPPEALYDPEVVILLTTETQNMQLLGLAAHSPGHCHGIEPALGLAGLAGAPGFHQHEGSPFGSLATSCASGGQMCFIANNSYLTSIPPNANDRQWMFDLISHEVGHCLTLGHVGDAGLTDTTDDSLAYPHHDILSYNNDGLRGTRTLCVSNLNALVVAKAYSGLLDPPGTAAKAPDPAAYIHMRPLDYSQPWCPESTASITDPSFILTADPLGVR